MSEEVYELKVGEVVPLERRLQTKGYEEATYTSANFTSASVLAYEPGNDSEGQVDSATASSITDASRTEATDFWKSLMLEFTTGDCEGERRKINTSGATGTITMDVTADPLPATPAVGDNYVIRGYPVVADTDLDGHADGVVSGSVAQFLASAANGCTASPRDVRIIITGLYTSGTFTQCQVADTYLLRVRASED